MFTSASAGQKNFGGFIRVVSEMKKFRYYFIKREFMLMKVDGMSCYMTPSEACEQMRNPDNLEMTYESCWMTQAEFEKIQEFGGF